MSQQKIAIVGSRKYPLESLVRETVRGIYRRNPTAIILSGGARGVDSWAVSEAKTLGLETVEFLADWDGEGKAAGFNRNTTIALHADVVLAFWDGFSHGTVDTIRKAVGMGRKVVVFGPTGQILQADEI